ncbi:MAG TPA: fumarylacetoacetate hydrolase family protein, partial [Egibacteraceae bacterium]|nr:fumarylacetoacetate hydrolase family protein [Egibacteraceae bacterium]
GLWEGERIRPLVSQPSSGSPLDVAPSAEGAAEILETAAIQILPPVRPGKIIAVGMNYRDHAEEQDQAPPEQPLLFAKFPSAACGPYDDIHKPSETTQLDYEVELGVVIGTRARHVTASEALRYVGGYLVIDDVSARDAQFADGQWVRGKSFDTFAPMGPCLATPDEIGDPGDLAIRAWVNGELRQDSNTENLVFDVPALIAYCSRYFTLEPGDVIATGTPGGVGVFLDPPQFLEPGDLVEAEVEGIGRLANRVIAVP